MLKDTPLTYINAIFNERGPVQYLVLVSGFSVSVAALLAFARSDIRSKVATLLVVLSLLPFFFGISGFMLGKISVDSAYATEMAGNPSQEEIADIHEFRAIGYGTTFDTVLLAIVIGVPTFILAMNLAIGCTPEPTRLLPPSEMPRVRFAKAWFLQFLGSQALGMVLGLVSALVIMSLLVPLFGAPASVLALLMAFGLHIVISYAFFKWSVSRFILRQILPSGDAPSSVTPTKTGGATLLLIGLILCSPFAVVALGHEPSVWTEITDPMPSMVTDTAIQMLRLVSPMVLLLATGCIWEGTKRLRHQRS